MCERMNRLEASLQRLRVDTSGLKTLSLLVNEVSGVVSGSAILDLRDIHIRMGGVVERVLLVLNVFWDSHEELLAMIDSAEHGIHLEKFRAVAHSLRGIFLEVGAAVCAEVASRAESIETPILLAEAQERLNELRRCVTMVARVAQSLLVSEKGCETLQNGEIV